MKPEEKKKLSDGAFLVQLAECSWQPEIGCSGAFSITLW